MFDTTSQSSKYHLKRFSSHWNLDLQSKCMTLVIISLKSVRDCALVYYSKNKVDINMYNLAFFEVSGGQCCDCNVNSGTETFAANVMSM